MYLKRHVFVMCGKLVGEEDVCFDFLSFFSVCDMFTICNGLFAMSVGVYGMLCYVTVDILKKQTKECHYCNFY